MSNIQAIVMMIAILAGLAVQYWMVRRTMRRVKKKYKRRFIDSWWGSWFVLTMGVLASVPALTLIFCAYFWVDFPPLPGWLLAALALACLGILLSTIRIPYRT